MNLSVFWIPSHQAAYTHIHRRWGQGRDRQFLIERDWGYLSSCLPWDSLQLEGKLNMKTIYKKKKRCKRELESAKKVGDERRDWKILKLWERVESKKEWGEMGPEEMRSLLQIIRNSIITSKCLLSIYYVSYILLSIFFIKWEVLLFLPR